MPHAAPRPAPHRLPLCLTLLLIAFIAALIAVSTRAYAQEPAPPAQKPMAQLSTSPLIAAAAHTSNALGTCGSVTITPLAAIPDGNPTLTCWNIPVSSVGYVTGVNLTVSLDHPWIGDLRLQLRSPLGSTLTMLNRPGHPVNPVGDNSDLLYTFPIRFLDSGATNAEAMGNTIGDTQAVCRDDGRCDYSPNPDNDGTSSLTTFAEFGGEASSGTWQFCASDHAPADTGTLISVTLDLACTDSTPIPTDTATATLTPTDTATPTPTPTASATPLGACGSVMITPNAAIPDNNPTLSCWDIPVSSVGYVTGVSLTLALAHTYIGDLRLQLRSPTARALTMLNRPGVPASPFGDNSNLSATFPIHFRDGGATDAEAMGIIIGDIASLNHL